ncbi:MAG: type I-E CRISPR-associated protein Cas6/Cse3/CasE [Phycisphaeraceae bacterium]|nr:type I-E CRISPR-associated protein Cas6/Cse3/CasE [Phycisphaeraceae bacterium]
MKETSRTLYLSLLELDSGSRQVRSELAHPYEMHRTLMRGFPQAATEARREYGVLFRAEPDEQLGRVAVYVQSLVEPDWSYLRNGEYLVREPEPPKDLARAYGRLRSGQELRFRIRANPTRRIARPKHGDEGIKGKRVALLREDQQAAWLARKGRERVKGCPGGFELLTREVVEPDGRRCQFPSVNICDEGPQWGQRNGGTLTHVAVRFDGILRITDADAFRATLARGIGPGKAFGFGLLSIAPVRGA